MPTAQALTPAMLGTEGWAAWPHDLQAKRACVSLAEQDGGWPDVVAPNLVCLLQTTGSRRLGDRLPVMLLSARAAEFLD